MVAMESISAAANQTVIPGRAKREPGIHNPGRRRGACAVPTLLEPGLWIPGSELRSAPE